MTFQQLPRAKPITARKPLCTVHFRGGQHREALFAFQEGGRRILLCTECNRNARRIGAATFPIRLS